MFIAIEMVVTYSYPWLITTFPPDDGTSPERLLSIMGLPDKVQQAASMISEILGNANVSVCFFCVSGRHSYL